VHCINKKNGNKIVGKWWGAAKNMFRMII